jgi:hypothetical protein
VREWALECQTRGWYVERVTQYDVDVIGSTIPHLLLPFILFLSHSTDVLMASLFTTIYFFAYSSQSPNIALLSCLLQTLGIVSYITLNIFSCLLRTLALSVHL